LALEIIFKGLNEEEVFMTSKERVLKAINHQQPDRPPVFATLTPQAAEKLSRFVGMPYELPLDSLLSTRISHTELLTNLGNDCVGIAACSPDDSPTQILADGTIKNEWGMRFRNIGLYNEFSEFPLAHAQTVEDIASYPFPDPFAIGRYDAAEATINKYGKDYAIIADLETSIFETAWYLTGLEKLFVDMAQEKPYVFALFDKIMNVNVEIGKKLITMGADIIWAGDDFGSQQGMMMSPQSWRNIFKPRIKFMFDEFRKANPKIKIAWHSCGSIVPIMPDFIEMGLDILNPIQPLAQGMDPTFLKSTYGNQLVFFGGIDIQQLLPHASVAEIKMEVKRISGILAKGGGYIVAPAHNIQDDTPVENIMAFFETIKEFENE
jgi:uroporphyrinogen decarboxylase